MKTIVLIPVKNEAWILDRTLKNITPHVDIVIVADQKSTDGSLEICTRFKNVITVTNPYDGHSNKVRWLLLDEARKFGQNNLIICIDADEIISPNAILQMKGSHAQKGDVFRFKWIQLWKNINEYRDDGVWKNNFKNIAFIDNPGVNEYRKDLVLNDHTSRIPDSKIENEIFIHHPLLHFHFIPWKRNQLKQAWYRCFELINGKRSARMINNTYRITLPYGKVKILTVPKEWAEDIELPQNLENISSPTHLSEIMGFFDKYGIEFFENLQIWHVPELKEEFVKRVGREPVSKTYPAWLSAINEIKNWIKNFKIK
ncbi:MAG: glycosyltransferase [bacterium]